MFRLELPNGEVIVALSSDALIEKLNLWEENRARLPYA